MTVITNLKNPVNTSMGMLDAVIFCSYTVEVYYDNNGLSLKIQSRQIKTGKMKPNKIKISQIKWN